MSTINNGDKKSFIEEIQSLNDTIKFRVIVVAAVFIMGIVVYVWLGYFNTLISSVPQDPTAQSQTVLPSTGGDDASTSGASGLASISAEFMNMIHGFIKTLQSPGQYIIKPQNSQ